MSELSSIRRRILKRRGVVLEPQTGKPLPYFEAPAPFRKTPTMKLLELRFQQPITHLLASGTIYECAKRLGIDATTVSKWRKRIRLATEPTNLNTSSRLGVDTSHPEVL